MLAPGLACGLVAGARYAGLNGTTVRRRVSGGQTLYEQGDPCFSLYVVLAGTFKSVMALSDGREQISGFHLLGDALALGCLAGKAHTATATALEDAQVCAIPGPLVLAHLASDIKFQIRLSRLMEGELLRSQRVGMALGSMRAKERIAGFLLDLSERAQTRGHSARDLNLPMTRTEIGSFLGLTLETVCRTLSDFRRLGSLRVDGRRIRFTCLEDFSLQYKPLAAI